MNTKNHKAVINQLTLRNMFPQADADWFEQEGEMKQEGKLSRVNRGVGTSKDKRKRDIKDRGYDD